MEAPMSHYEENISQLIKLSMSSGCNDFRVIDPEFISSTDISDEFLDDFYGKLEKEYEYISLLKYHDISLVKDDDEKKDKLVNLISWVIKTLKNWKNDGLYS